MGVPMRSFLLLFTAALLAFQLLVAADPLKTAQVYADKDKQCDMQICCFPGTGCSESPYTCGGQCSYVVRPLATPAFTLELNQANEDFNFTGDSLYYKDTPLSSGECKIESWYTSSGSDCIYTYHYQDTYVAYFYPDGPLELAINLKFVLDADNVNVNSFNSSAFLELVSSRLGIALDRMTIKVGKGATGSGQVQVTVGVRDSKAWERDLVDRWADDAYVADFAPEFFVQALTYADVQPDGPSSGSAAAQLQAPLALLLQ